MEKPPLIIIIFSKYRFLKLYWSKYSNGRQDVASFFANIMTANRVFDATGWNTLATDIISDTIRMNTFAADGIPVTTAEIL